MKKQLSLILAATMAASLWGCATRVPTGAIAPAREKPVKEKPTKQKTIAERSASTGAAASSYPNKALPVGTDRLILIDSEASSATKTSTLESLQNGWPWVDLSATAPIAISPSGAVSLLSTGLAANQTWVWNGSAFAAASITGGSAGYLPSPPSSPTDACTPGQYALTESYRYDCITSGNWNQTALTDWAVTLPTLSSATIPSSGNTISLGFSMSVSAGAGGSGGFDVDCDTSGQNISATYASGAPGLTLVYNLGTTVKVGEICNLDYTQPGNGIEGTTGGGDLLSITNRAITNNSSVPPSTAGKVNDIQVYEGALGDPYKVCIWSDSGAVLECTGAISHAGTNGVRTISWDGPTLSASTHYYLGIVASNGDEFGYVGTWASRRNLNSYLSPAAIAPGTDAGQALGELYLSVRNASGVKLIGRDSGTVTVGSVFSTNEAKYYNAGYTYAP